MKYEFIKTHSSEFSVVTMCRVLSISESGYYRWKRNPISVRKMEENLLKDRIHQLFKEHKGMAGSPLICADLQDEERWESVSVNRVARLMRELGLRCRATKKFVTTTNSNHKEPVAPNLLERKFTTQKPDQVWVTDITYIRVAQKWCYLTVFIDLYSRMIIGWDLSESMERTSVMAAFGKAWWKRRPEAGIMIHSDRGVQYASKDFRSQLETYGAVQSMSRKGNCWDNAVAESFFHTLKTEYVYHYKFKNIVEVEQALFWYIEVYYNRRRKHSTNGFITPMSYEELFWMKEKQA
jgi:putative transposase